MRGNENSRPALKISLGKYPGESARRGNASRRHGAMAECRPRPAEQSTSVAVDRTRFGRFETASGRIR